MDINSTDDTFSHKCHIDHKKVNMHGIRNICFEGGGMRALGYYGAVKALHELKIIHNKDIVSDIGIKRCAGSSAGSFVALLVILGFELEDIEKFVNAVNLDQFADIDNRLCNWLKCTYNHSNFVYRFIFKVAAVFKLTGNKYGVYNGDKLELFFKQVVIDGFIRLKEAYQKTHDDNPFPDTDEYTFKHLYDITGRELILTGSNISTGRLEYFSPKLTPDMPIYKAIRITGSYPFFFKSVKRNNEYYVDGGLLNNYPIEVFLNDEFSRTIIYSEKAEHVFSRTIGFKIIDSNESIEEDGNNVNIKHDITNLKTFTTSLIGSLVNRTDNLMIDLVDRVSRMNCHFNPKDENDKYCKGYHTYWDVTIGAVIDEVDTLQNDVSNETKKLMSEKWYNAVMDYYKSTD